MNLRLRTSLNQRKMILPVLTDWSLWINIGLCEDRFEIQFYLFDFGSFVLFHNPLIKVLIIY